MTRLNLDQYILASLMPDLVGHDRSPTAFIVYLHLTSLAAGNRARRVQVSLQRIADDTGLSKSAVQGAVRLLLRRRLIRQEKASRTAVPVYEVLRPWTRQR